MPLLPTFDGMENENPYTHIQDFEEVCITFKEGAFDMDFLKLKAFPLTLKDKYKIWLNSLRPRTIMNWAELQAEFLKKFFSAHKTNNLKRKIYTFAAHDSERFYQCWERYLETISACPHHGFDTWMLVNHFYDGMSPSMKQLLETMCGGDFLSKNPDEAMEFLNYVAKTSKGWDEQNPREVERMKPTANSRGGIYALTEEMEMKAKLSSLTRRLEDLELRNQHEVQEVTEPPVLLQSCFKCQSTSHQGDQCPIASSIRDSMQEQANIVDQGRHPISALYRNTYNPDWRNHPNLSWKPKTQAYTPTGSQQKQTIPSSPVEQAIVNLSKVVGHFVEEQKTVNAQTTQKIEMLEGTFNKRLDDLQCSVSKLASQQQIQEKEKSPSQKQPIPSGVHEECSYSNPNSKLNEVKAIITLRSGKELTKPSPKATDPEQKAIDTTPREVVIKQTVEEYKPPPLFPQSLRTKKKAINQAEILEVLRQVKVNIPLLDMIKQVPTYAKFLKDLCTVKKGLNIDKKAFLTEQVSAIIQCKTPVKYKDPSCPTISVNIGGICVEKALLDLGASVNLLPYSMYRQLGLRELKPTSITLSLADRSIKIPKGIVEDVLIQVDKFYYPIDFVVLDTEPVVAGANYVPIILGRPFLATSNAVINCRNGVMQLTFRNMTLELNIFHLSKKHM